MDVTLSQSPLEPISQSDSATCCQILISSLKGTALTLISAKDLNLLGSAEVSAPERSMWFTFLIFLTLCSSGRSAENATAEVEELVIARGKLLRGGMIHKEDAGALPIPDGAMGVIYDSGEDKNPRLIFYNDKDEEVKRSEKGLPVISRHTEACRSEAGSAGLPGTMPVFYTPIPQNLRAGLTNASSSVFLNNRTRDSTDFREHAQENEESAEVSSHLPLQMLLYFNICFFPFWWISEVIMLQLKFCYLPLYYQCLLVTGVILISICELLRMYLGYSGNLKEKVPELAGFWLISFLFQLPILLFFITDQDILILPLERAVHSVYLIFLLAELSTSFLALRVMTRKLARQFHLKHFIQVDGLHAAEALPMFALPHGGRSVLPVRDIQPH
ncbi:hypothetical protein DNTS_035323 [Danionella cerebrum]|uniref:Transmembrane protein 17 n=1 Tax=Danionella cerebrum TaxID=2873325 RepID=A0A553QC45_9TELE|nr:hypothetical protein DNTS_035323 [Danionella translucida]TRY87504.1 hypothetical protein DNTS_035323 [Danionella translucida]